jgi:hypothetical protein
MIELDRYSFLWAGFIDVHKGGRVNPPISDDDAPFLIRNHSKVLLRSRAREELADYDLGFQTGLAGEDFDDRQSPSWQRGWTAAQE